jgi:DNA-binding NarL/FixJ family response regulator
MKKIRILIADDQTLMRDGLKTIFDLEDDMEVIAVAENGEQALQLTRDLHPDIVLMDIRMPVMDGVESTRLIKKQFPEVIVIILTTFNDEEYIIQALNFGASGYLLKDIPGERLIQAVRDSITGNLMMPSSVAAKLAGRLSNMRKAETERIKELSEREIEIAKLIVSGKSNRDIANMLYITEGTVKNYISAIYNKVGTSDRTKAIKLLKVLLNDISWESEAL